MKPSDDEFNMFLVARCLIWYGRVFSADAGGRHVIMFFVFFKVENFPFNVCLSVFCAEWPLC